MGEIIASNIPIDTFVVATVEQVNWDQALVNWDAYQSDRYYARYLEHEFNKIIPNPPNDVLWDHAVILTISYPSSFDYQDQQKDRQKSRKKIKVIFMMDDLTKVIDKEKNNLVKANFKDKVENILTEKIGQKVILEDVHIIHR